MASICCGFPATSQRIEKGNYWFQQQINPKYNTNCSLTTALFKSPISTSNLRRSNSLNKTSANDEFLKLMYYSLRNQLKQSVDEADWINKDIKNFVNEKVADIFLTNFLLLLHLYNLF